MATKLSAAVDKGGPGVRLAPGPFFFEPTLTTYHSIIRGKYIVNRRHLAFRIQNLLKNFETDPKDLFRK